MYSYSLVGALQSHCHDQQTSILELTKGLVNCLIFNELPSLSNSGCSLYRFVSKLKVCKTRNS